MAVQVGSIFRWRKDALGIAAGAFGICYGAIDADLSGILFDTGVPVALSELELHQHARCEGFAHGLATYRFDGLIQLLEDFDRGVFAGAFGARSHSAAA